MNLLDKLKAIARASCLKGREQSPDATGICPLESVRSAVVFFDADIPGCIDTINRIQDYFTKIGKSVTIFGISLGAQLISEGRQKAIFLHKRDINWYGKIRRGKSHPSLDRGEDLFISLYPEDSFPVEYAARCSKARFKTGRKQLKGNTYDLILTYPEDTHLTQNQAFEGIMDFIQNIKY